MLLILNSFTHGNADLMLEIFLKSALNRMGDRSKRRTEDAYIKYLNQSIQKAQKSCRNELLGLQLSQKNKVIAKYYELIEKYGCTFIIMYHTKKDSSIKSVSEKVIGSQALSGSADTIIAINKASEFDTEFNLCVTSRLFESKVYQVKIYPSKKLLKLDKVDPIEILEPSI